MNSLPERPPKRRSLDHEIPASPSDSVNSHRRSQSTSPVQPDPLDETSGLDLTDTPKDDHPAAGALTPGALTREALRRTRKLLHQSEELLRREKGPESNPARSQPPDAD